MSDEDSKSCVHKIMVYVWSFMKTFGFSKLGDAKFEKLAYESKKAYKQIDKLKNPYKKLANKIMIAVMEFYEDLEKMRCDDSQDGQMSLFQDEKN
ncbi:MAG: hypothetical protein LBM69_05180 [Lachnospiraceae bacterium]|jgi:hypothetical protein|nr:hypothetical protein [Lachnospiraceae bacterium]